MSKKKLGAKKLAGFKPKKGAKYFVSDPSNADRVLDVLGRKIVFTPDPFERFAISGKEAVEVKESFPYLVVAEEL